MSEHSHESLPCTSVPRHPPITQQSVVLCSMFMFRMGKEARKQSDISHQYDMFNPYEPVPIPALLQMTLTFLLVMAMIILVQTMNKNPKLREQFFQQWQSKVKMFRSTDAFVFLTALFG